ncbi:MAG TPA: 30S ribosomal protein S20 [Acidimicrobiia bacterium]|jgi:small subunit ribosomal protein S20
MANIKGQIKRNRQNERRRLRNKAVRSELKSRVKVADQAIAEGSADAPEALRQAQKRLGKAAARGRIHKNQAARRTSRLMQRAARPAGTTTRATGATAKKATGTRKKATGTRKKAAGATKKRG